MYVFFQFILDIKYGTTKIKNEMKHKKKNIHFRGNYFCFFCMCPASLKFEMRPTLGTSI